MPPAVWAAGHPSTSLLVASGGHEMAMPELESADEQIVHRIAAHAEESLALLGSAACSWHVAQDTQFCAG